ncbi:hypothetical protein HRG_004672 [Hirsutella rhossiliensis]|uniref:Uncharacterized protein n=1 Tax=Hirsutella rhossiliensis TaxID=111463 RepID=A0A9P8N1K9_9HYPO|nr:uncharacterized protein HRG_04672 [Hirsutella rhossiliensis]KAH0964244.1 hypothetical protein HRG_04672 [Hirsutella rhossiliensis]
MNFNGSQLAARWYTDVLAFVRTAAVNHLNGLKPMAREHPEQRASEAQMLVLHFGGEGLTARRSDPTSHHNPDLHPEMSLAPGWTNHSQLIHPSIGSQMMSVLRSGTHLTNCPSPDRLGHRICGGRDAEERLHAEL